MMRIFAIDDEAAALGLLEFAIAEVAPSAEYFGFSSVGAMLEKAKETPPDVVFSDIEMPGTSGIDLAEKLQEIHEKVNIVFVTGYSNYALDALKHYACDYIMKPVSADAVRQAMAHLRFPVCDVKKITVKTFGHFAVFADGAPVSFRLEKSKELLAYLVDREGAPITRREAAAVLYEEGNFDRNEQKYLSRVVLWLTQDLAGAGIAPFFRNENGQYSVNTALADCDLYRYLSGERELFHGEYMEQYSFGEDRKAFFSFS